jgi:ectoine hydroxylase-related dioxygenase (phytanoyl-CoA dioxygenase family)
VWAKRFAKVAADLMGVPAVRLFQDEALFKESGGGLTPWHQDQFYWPLDTVHTITLWMPLVDCSEGMGTMRFASGSHHEGYLGDIPISDQGEAHFKEYIQSKGFSLAGGKAMKAGDSTWHSGWVLHAASPNTTGTMREAMTIKYFADGARVKILNQTHREAEDYMGAKEGEVVNSPKMPVLYRR